MMRWSIFLTLVLSFCLAGCGRTTPAPPVNGEQLRLDCIRLLDLPEGEISPDKWPLSVKALQPLEVEKQSDRIVIVRTHEDHRFTTGYYIYADPQTSPSQQSVWIQKTAWKGVFGYKTQY